MLRQSQDEEDFKKEDELKIMGNSKRKMKMWSHKIAFPHKNMFYRTFPISRNIFQKLWIIPKNEFLIGRHKLWTPSRNWI